jgi:hypothetical protein
MTLAHLDTLIAFTVVMLGVSLIITVLTQTVSALLGLRGTNLLWGTKTVFKTIDPELEAHAESILTHPIISDSLWSRFCGVLKDIPLVGRMARRWTLATAIRSGEIVSMLTARAQHLRAAGGEANLAAASRIDAALEASDASTARQIRILNEAFHDLAPHYALQIDKILDQVTTASQQALGSVESRFNTAMDRVSQRFAAQMRIWTVIFSILLAIGVPLDTFQLFDRLWADPQTRESLVNTRSAMMKEADTIIQTSSGAPQTAGPGTEPQVYAAAFQQLKTQHPEETDGMGEMPTMPGYDAARMWLTDNLVQNEKRINAPDTNNQAIYQDYAKSVAAALADKANEIRQKIESSGLDLIPQPYRFLHFDGYRNFLGALISAVLLSLGAPFWFNALKSLSNLRPILANKQDQGG